MINNHLTYTHNYIYHILLPTILFPIFYILTINNYQNLSHKIKKYPNLIIIQLKLNNNYISKTKNKI